MLERRHCQPAASDDAGSCDSRRKQRWLGALEKKTVAFFAGRRNSAVHRSHGGTRLSLLSRCTAARLLNGCRGLRLCTGVTKEVL
jgi:hypothetical protein